MQCEVHPMKGKKLLSDMMFRYLDDVVQSGLVKGKNLNDSNDTPRETSTSKMKKGLRLGTGLFLPCPVYQMPDLHPVKCRPLEPYIVHRWQYPVTQLGVDARAWNVQYCVKDSKLYRSDAVSRPFIRSMLHRRVMLSVTGHGRQRWCWILRRHQERIVVSSHGFIQMARFQGLFSERKALFAQRSLPLPRFSYMV